METYFKNITWRATTRGILESLRALQAYIDTHPEPTLPADVRYAVKHLLQLGGPRFGSVDAERAFKDLARWSTKGQYVSFLEADSEVAAFVDLGETRFEPVAAPAFCITTYLCLRQDGTFGVRVENGSVTAPPMLAISDNVVKVLAERSRELQKNARRAQGPPK